MKRKLTVYSCDHGEEIPLAQALKEMTPGWVEAGNCCEQTTIDLLDCCRVLRQRLCNQERRAYAFTLACVDRDGCTHHENGKAMTPAEMVQCVLDRNMRAAQAELTQLRAERLLLAKEILNIPSVVAVFPMDVYELAERIVAEGGGAC